MDQAPGCGMSAARVPLFWLRAAANAERESRAPALWLYAGPPERSVWSRRGARSLASPPPGTRPLPFLAIPAPPLRALVIDVAALHRPTRSVQSYVAMPRYKYFLVWRATVSLLPANPVLARLCSPTAISRDGRAARLGRACPRKTPSRRPGLISPPAFHRWPARPLSRHLRDQAHRMAVRTLHPARGETQLRQRIGLDPQNAQLAARQFLPRNTGAMTLVPMQSSVMRTIMDMDALPYMRARPRRRA